jgi:hypothetical protein
MREGSQLEHKEQMMRWRSKRTREIHTNFSISRRWRLNDKKYGRSLEWLVVEIENLLSKQCSIHIHVSSRSRYKLFMIHFDEQMLPQNARQSNTAS